MMSAQLWIASRSKLNATADIMLMSVLSLLQPRGAAGKCQKSWIAVMKEAWYEGGIDPTSFSQMFMISCFTHPIPQIIF